MARETITLGRIHRLVHNPGEKSLRLECTGTPAEREALTSRERADVLAAFERHVKSLTRKGYWVSH